MLKRRYFFSGLGVFHGTALLVRTKQSFVETLQIFRIVPFLNFEVLLPLEQMFSVEGILKIANMPLLQSLTFPLIIMMLQMPILSLAAV